MADELEVLEKQQLSAQKSLNDLTDQLTLADHLVYKKYLTELQNYGMVELSQQMLDVQDPAQCIQLFQLQKLTLKKGEDMFQKLSTVYYSSMAQGCSPGGPLEKEHEEPRSGYFQQGAAKGAELQLPRL